MNHHYVSISLVFPAVMLVACDESKDDLPVDYQAHASEALNEVRQFRENSMSAESKSMMAHNVGEHMHSLGEVRGKMMDGDAGMMGSGGM